MDTKARLDKLVTEAGTVAILDVDGQDQLRVVIEDAGAANIIDISAKLTGQKDFVHLKQLVGPVNEKVNISTYEEVKIECSAIDALDVAIRIIASSFKEASGSAIEIDVPAGDSLSDIEVLTLTSSDNSVVITGDNATKSIDFKVNLNLDDVKEYPSLVDFPPVGESSTLYVALDTEKIYRWSGSTYIEVSPSPVTSVNSQTGDVVLDKSSIGLGNVDNTSDINKPISTATQTALNLKQDSLGFTPENIANKSDDSALGTSSSLYPTQKAVKEYVDSAVTAGAPDADATTKGILKLTGDLGGTADLPTVPGLATKYDASNPAGYITLAQVPASAVTSVNSQTGDVVLNKSDIGLGNVDNTSDVNKPISTATQTALNTKYDASNPSGYITLAEVPASPVTSVNTQTGAVVLTKSDIGLSNVDDTSDINKPISTATQTALNAKQDSLGFTPENVTNKSTDTALGTSDSLYPSQKAVKTYVDNAVTAGAPDANSTTKGILKLTGDLGGTADSPTVPALASKQDVLVSTTNIKSINGQSILGSGDLVVGGAVDSVNGQTGVVTLDKSDIGLGNVDNTSDLDKPISTATQTALSAKYDASNPAGYITLAQVPPDAVTSVNGLTGAVVISTGNPISVSDEGTQITASAASINFTGGGVTASSDLSGNVTVSVSTAGDATTLIVEAYNDTGATIPKMSVVYINGAHGNLPKLSLSLGNAEPTSSKTLGIVRSDISNMNNGFVVAAGKLIDLDTNIVGWNEGDSLWLSPSVAGGITNVKPLAPNHAVFVGTLIRKHPTQGIIEVKIQNGFELQELHNVSINGISDGQIIRYENATSLWKNVSLNSDGVSEGSTNLYFTDARARTAAVADSIVDGVVNIAPSQNAVFDALANKQATLVSTTNIKTINGVSILGSGDLVVSGGGAVDSVNGQVGNVILDKSDIGLGNVDNTSDANKPISTATQTALNLKQDTLVSSTNIKTINGNSILGSGNLAISGAVDSVNGQVGVVVLNKSDIGLGSVDNTSDANKPISTATQLALNGKYDSSNPDGYITLAEVPAAPVTSVNTLTGAVVLAKSDIGLGNVDNTSDANKPISTATQTALNDKVAKAGDSMTGALTITKANDVALTTNNLKFGNPWGAGYSVLTVADGVTDEFYIQSADQLGAFAGTASKPLTFNSGYTSGANSGIMRILSGDVTAGEGSTGGVQINSGTPSENGSSGNVDIYTGNGNGTGSTGYLYFRTGTKNGTTGSSGAVVFDSGINNGSGASGFARISTGATNLGTSGNIDLFTGNSNASNTGFIQLFSGRVLSGSGTTGSVNILSGRNDSATAGNTGSATFGSGRILNATSTGSTGATRVQTGNAAGTGNSGSIDIETGTVTTGTRGDIRLKASNIWLSGPSNFGVIQVSDNGVYAKRQLLVQSLDSSTYIHADLNNSQYPSLWLTSSNHTSTKFASLGALGATGNNAGGIAVKGAHVQGTIDGTFTAGHIYLESRAESQYNDTAANLQINSGNVYVQTSDAFIKGTGTAASSGDIVIKTGNAAGTGARGQVRVLSPYLNMETNEIINTAAFYFGDPNVDGTYRIRPSGSNLVTERRESGIWVVKQTITP